MYSASVHFSPGHVETFPGLYSALEPRQGSLAFWACFLISALCGAKFPPTLILLVTLEKWKIFAVSFKMLYAG